MKNFLDFKINWKSMAYWKRGLLIGILCYLGICVLPLLLCIFNFLGIIKEGYEGAGLILIFLGLPTTLLEMLIEEYDPPLFLQIIDLFILAFINCIGIGAFVGFIVEKREKV